MLTKESLPGAALPCTHGCGRDVFAFEHVSYGGAPNPMAEFEQLSFDFAIAPTRVFSSQTHDQRFEFHCDTRSTHSSLAAKGPLVALEVPMPTQHGFRREQQEA